MCRTRDFASCVREIALDGICVRPDLEDVRRLTVMLRLSCEAGAIAFVKPMRGQPRQRGCSRECCPNKQKPRFPASPGTAAFRLCGNKDTARKVAYPRKIPLAASSFSGRPRYSGKNFASIRTGFIAGICPPLPDF